MERRYKRINDASKELSEEAFRAYTGKKDYKRAIEIYYLLAESICVPKEISNFSKNMLGKLSKQIKEKS
ncbi:hypothetical protein [Asaccharospora irregularis]|uniref:Uncharacterized protein n=1 Tax=Asaccharospora irregularis DSM 2635 TaxID=1121321 RepID=A0A1M5MXL1_9FIRM|nr:hypothetical protein [Asaccharospora irregularis]SHG81955.1 hypothetical protein SAMN04488530_10856 [Asaccharospora irregularis DSM 2635]